MKNTIGIIVILILAIASTAIVLRASQYTTVIGAEPPESDNTQTQINFMEEVVTRYPTYHDAHMELSRLYLLEGNVTKAKESLTRAKEIDPNSNSIENYEEIISSLD